MTAALLDTSVLIEPPAAGQRPDQSAISVLSLGELEVGVLLADGAAEGSRRLDRLIRVRDEFDPLPVDEAVVRAYAYLVSSAREAKRNPRVIDTLIAATARAHGLVLHTRDREQATLAEVEIQLL